MTTTQSAADGSRTQLPGGGPSQAPVQPLAVKDAKATRELVFTLRHFHLGDPGAAARLEALGDDLLPALLDPYRDTSRLRYDYPLILFPAAAGDGHRQAADLAAPLSDWLHQALQAFAPGEGARILRDHLPWLEHQMRQALAQSDGPLAAAAPLAEAGAALQAHLRLPEAEQRRLATDLEQLLAQLPAGASLLAYGRYAALHLLVHAVHSRVLPRRQRFRTLIGNCIRGLRALFQVEWSKSDAAIEPAQARDSVGPGAALFDAAALSEVMDHARGTHEMPAERRRRIETALATLEHWQDDAVLVHFVHSGGLAVDWLAGDPSLAEHQAPDPCAQASALFDQEAARLAHIFAAVRVAQLEINGIYDPAIHDPWFASFGWEGFTQDELLLVPTVIAIEAADRVAGDGLRPFSRLLSSGRPVQILIRVQPSNNPGAEPGEDPFRSYRIELGYLGLSHRQAVVVQTSTARHQHLLGCALAALDATRTGLHLINTGLRPATRLVPLNAWLVAGAALEGRAHPFFRIDPQAGDSADRRFDFSGNPQPEHDWPRHPFHYVDENGQGVDLELAFTFADYALLVDHLRDHFRLIPPGCDTEVLVALQDYLAMRPDDAYQRIPYSWGVDGNGLLHRLVISRALALACLDRLNFWHRLQELGGVRNQYVDQAIERTRAEERAQAQPARDRLAAEQAAALARVRREAAGEAMQRLADLLLGLDLSQAAPARPAAPPRPVAATPAVETPPAAPAAPAAAPAPPPAQVLDDPWIDTPLCTSCNDCFKVNPLLFAYNDDKQAYLGDLSQGSYAQLVQAAELCPAHCIHPGQPWNPDEPGLAELLERAAPYHA
jgi:ferredoxin